MFPSSPRTTSNTRPNLFLLFIAFFGISFVLLNVLLFRRYEWMTNFVDTVMNPPLAFITTLLAAALLRQVSQNPRASVLWIGLTLGWACWTIAECIWTVAFLQGIETPYPSWADLFWCVGYLPMFVALIIRSRSLTAKPGKLNQVIMILVSLLIVGFTVYGILLPIVQAYDPSTLVESILNLYYPLADTVLLVLALRILFSARKGTFAIAWLWISLGIILSAIADLFFTYLSGLDLYYPDGQATVASVFLSDMPYTLSYVLLIVGLVLLWQMKPQSGQLARPRGRSPAGR